MVGRSSPRASLSTIRLRTGSHPPLTGASDWFEARPSIADCDQFAGGDWLGNRQGSQSVNTPTQSEQPGGGSDLSNLSNLPSHSYVSSTAPLTVAETPAVICGVARTLTILESPESLTSRIVMCQRVNWYFGSVKTDAKYLARLEGTSCVTNAFAMIVCVSFFASVVLTKFGKGPLVAFS